MIDNVVVQCNYCNTKIRMRFQMGYFDIPFDICCPGCGVHIKGLRELQNGDSTTVENATKIQCKLDDVDYYADFSVELPHAKIAQYESLEKIMEAGFSPFMMTSSLYGGEKYFKLREQVKLFLSFRDSIWPRLKPLFNLFFERKIALTEEHFLKLAPRFVVKNELDALMALHQTVVLGMSHILVDGTLENFIAASKQIITSPVRPQIDGLCVALGGKEYFNSLAKRLVKIYDRWMINFEKYIPATMLSIGHASEKLDREKFGIATTSFEDMKCFYSDSYELILDFIGVAIGLNNILVRGDYNSFPRNNNQVDKRTSSVSVRNFSDYRKIVKSSRLGLLVDDEPFSKAIPLNRNVRNAIAHFDYDFDAGTQKISFNDRYKNKNNTVELYLTDLALLCYENMAVLIYLDELSYNLRKFQYISEGMVPNIRPPKQ